MAPVASAGLEIVDQMGFFNDQIPGDLHGLRDEHQRHGVDGEENPFAAEAFFGEDISGVERDYQRESHRQKGGHDAVEEVAGERDAGGFDIGGDVQKIIHGGLLHEKAGWIGEQLVHGLEGRGEDIDDGEQHHRREGDQVSVDFELGQAETAGVYLAALKTRHGVFVLSFPRSVSPSPRKIYWRAGIRGGSAAGAAPTTRWRIPCCTAGIPGP